MKRNSTPPTKGNQSRATDSVNRKASKTFEHENDTENRVYNSITDISNHLSQAREAFYPTCADSPTQHPDVSITPNTEKNMTVK